MKIGITDGKLWPNAPGKIDALTLGAQLREEEARLSAERIANALPYGSERGISLEVTRTMRDRLAMVLYEAHYEHGRSLVDDDPSPEDVLETMCWAIFGATFKEVLAAWDKSLG